MSENYMAKIVGSEGDCDPCPECGCRLRVLIAEERTLQVTCAACGLPEITERRQVHERK